MSQDSASLATRPSDACPERTNGETQCTEAQQTPDSKGYSAPGTNSQDGDNAQGSDRSRPSGERGSDKQDDKQNDKRERTDPQLTGLVNAWPDLPDAVKAGIVAMVKAAMGG